MARSFASTWLAPATLACVSLGALAFACASSEVDPNEELLPAEDASTDGSPRLDATRSPDVDNDDRAPNDAAADVRDANKADAASTSDATYDADASVKPEAGAEAGADAGADGSASVDGASTFDGGDSGTAMPPGQGDVVFSEIMYNPSGTEPESEWIELHNPTNMPRLLSGLVLKDGTVPFHTHAIGPNVVVPPGGYVVLANRKASVIAALVPAGVVVYEYGDGTADVITLGNSPTGSVVLLSGANEVARAKYGPLGLGNAQNGQSIQLMTLTYAGAAVATNWCLSPKPWAGGSDLGTPGAPSDCQ